MMNLIIKKRMENGNFADINSQEDINSQDYSLFLLIKLKMLKIMLIMIYLKE